MDTKRKREIHQFLEACYETDNSNLEAEKTAVIAELLAEVEQSGKGGAGSGDHVQPTAESRDSAPDPIAVE
jgi:hypothetical protein